MRRSLGQHFLIHRRAIQRILQALELSGSENVLEIGPGKGALTGSLARRAGRLLLVEKDPFLAEVVQQHFSSEDSVEILTADFLELPFEEITTRLGREFRVVSNLPYQAATAILQRLLLNVSPGTRLVLMFQKEVGDRLLAGPGTKDYGSLSIFTQVLAKGKVLFEITPMAFRPPPQVDSVVVKLKVRDQPLVAMEELPKFESLTRAGFAHRRKMLRQNLKTCFTGETAEAIEQRLKAVGASPGARAEELSVEQWVELYKGWKP
jgi:16S rRNA (adenine1518-N6/adenine1519-N6)-dimethyltransferase